MNRFEKMNIEEQTEICGGMCYPLGPIMPTWIIKKIAPVAAGAVAGAVMGATAVLSAMK